MLPIIKSTSIRMKTNNQSLATYADPSIGTMSPKVKTAVGARKSEDE